LTNTLAHAHTLTHTHSRALTRTHTHAHTTHTHARARARSCRGAVLKEDSEDPVDGVFQPPVPDEDPIEVLELG